MRTQVREETEEKMETDSRSHAPKAEFHVMDKENVWHTIRMCLLIPTLICSKRETKPLLYKERLLKETQCLGD